MGYIIKLSTPWNHDFLRKTPSGIGVFGDYKFEIDNNCSVCDYWIIWGDLKEKCVVKCPLDNIIYLADETHSERKFNSEFIAQFSAVIACRQDIPHSRVILTHDLGIWHLNKTYDEVNTNNVYIKDKEISVISSDLTLLTGHKKRFAFVNQLMGHFMERVDFYGRGLNPIEDKWDGLSSYKYSVAIENNYTEGYFTEKLYECFLSNTLPVYHGCPDLEKYFDDRAFVRIDISDFKRAFVIIDELIKENIYESRLPYLLEARKIYMDKYFIFPALVNIINDNFLSKTRKRDSVMIHPEQYFLTSFLKKAYIKAKRYLD